MPGLNKNVKNSHCINQLFQDLLGWWKRKLKNRGQTEVQLLAYDFQNCSFKSSPAFTSQRFQPGMFPSKGNFLNMRQCSQCLIYSWRVLWSNVSTESWINKQTAQNRSLLLLWPNCFAHPKAGWIKWMRQVHLLNPKQQKKSLDGVLHIPPRVLLDYWIFYSKYEHLPLSSLPLPFTYLAIQEIFPKKV